MTSLAGVRAAGGALESRRTSEAQEKALRAAVCGLERSCCDWRAAFRLLRTGDRILRFGLAPADGGTNPGGTNLPVEGEHCAWLNEKGQSHIPIQVHEPFIVWACRPSSRSKIGNPRQLLDNPSSELD